jgi:hypothetical protein
MEAVRNRSANDSTSNFIKGLGVQDEEERFFSVGPNDSGNNNTIIFFASS